MSSLTCRDCRRLPSGGPNVTLQLCKPNGFPICAFRIRFFLSACWIEVARGRGDQISCHRSTKHAKRSTLQESTSGSLIRCDHEKTHFHISSGWINNHCVIPRGVTGFRVILIINIMNKQTRRSSLQYVPPRLAATLPSFYVQGLIRAALAFGGWLRPHTYECITTGWCACSWLGDTHAFAKMSTGTSMLGYRPQVDMRGEAIVVFDEKGRLFVPLARLQGGAHGLKLRREERMNFSTIATSTVAGGKTTLSGEVIWIHGYPRRCELHGAAIDFVPTNVAFPRTVSFT